MNGSIVKVELVSQAVEAEDVTPPPLTVAFALLGGVGVVEEPFPIMGP